MANDDMRQLLDGRGAWKLSERLRAAGLPVDLEAAPLDQVAEVLAQIHGSPDRSVAFLLDRSPTRLG